MKVFGGISFHWKLIISYPKITIPRCDRLSRLPGQARPSPVLIATPIHHNSPLPSSSSSRSCHQLNQSSRHLQLPSAPPALSSRPIRYPGDIALTCETRIQLNLRPSTAPLPCLCNAEHKSSAAVKAVPLHEALHSHWLLLSKALQLRGPITSATILSP